jgi:hypothetical protein
MANRERILKLFFLKAFLNITNHEGGTRIPSFLLFQEEHLRL